MYVCMHASGNPRGKALIHIDMNVKRRWVFKCPRFFADANIKALLMENEKVLKLIQSELLQTEIRVLYELLYILSNSYSGNKTFKSLKQVRTGSCSILLN